MAHYAELDENNIVLQVIVVRNQDCLDENGQESEAIGAAYANSLFGGRWLKTSYNTLGNQHNNNGTPLRGNYASIGYTYDPINDVFIAPKPFESWILNTSTWLWEAPVPEPKYDYTKEICVWNENTKNWVIKQVKIKE